MLLDGFDVVRLFQNDTMFAEVALAELLQDLAVHYTMDVAFANKLVPAFSRWCEEERDDCPEDDAAYVTNFDQVA